LELDQLKLHLEHVVFVGVDEISLVVLEYLGLQVIEAVQELIYLA